MEPGRFGSVLERFQLCCRAEIGCQVARLQKRALPETPIMG
jgi:hypothetical protein